MKNSLLYWNKCFVYFGWLVVRDSLYTGLSQFLQAGTYTGRQMLPASKLVRRHTSVSIVSSLFQYSTVKCVFYKEGLVSLTNNRTVPNSGQAL